MHLVDYRPPSSELDQGQGRDSAHLLDQANELIEREPVGE